MKVLYSGILLTLLSLNSCKNTNKPEISPYDDLIRNPQTATASLDTLNIPKLYFPENKYDFGSVIQGDSIIHIFPFYNRGNAVLLITQVSSSCGCTVPKIYKEKLQPGDSSTLRVVFNTKDKNNFQEKDITIFANTFPPETKVTLTGYVKK